MITRCQATVKRLSALSRVWMIGLLLGFLPALAEQPHFTPAVFDGERIVLSSQEYSLDARSERSVALSNPLIGFWEHRNLHGTVTLEVITDDMMVVSGREMKYQVLPGIIRLMDGEGEFDYSYRLVNDRLILTISDGESAPRDVSFRWVDLTQGELGYSPENRSYH
jgi:hypothetical protein